MRLLLENSASEPTLLTVKPENIRRLRELIDPEPIPDGDFFLPNALLSNDDAPSASQLMFQLVAFEHQG